MTVKLLILLSILRFAAGEYRLTCPAPSIQAVEGDDVTLRYQLDPPIDLSACTVDVKRDDNKKIVHAYRHGKDHLDPQTDQYRNRTTLNHADLIGGILTLQISSVNLSDSGPYKGFVPKCKAGCVCNLTVVPKDQQQGTERGDSGTTRPPVEEVTDHDAAKTEALWKTVPPSVIGVAVVVAAFLFLRFKRGAFRICKKTLRGMNGQEAEMAPNNHEMETLNGERDEDPHSPADNVLTEVVIGGD